MLGAIFAYGVVIYLIVCIIKILKGGHIVTGTVIDTKVEKADHSSRPGFISTFLIDGAEYTEDKALSNICPKKGKDVKVILRDDDTVTDFGYVKGLIILAVFFALIRLPFLPAAIGDIMIRFNAAGTFPIK